MASGGSHKTLTFIFRCLYFSGHLISSLPQCYLYQFISSLLNIGNQKQRITIKIAQNGNIGRPFPADYRVCEAFVPVLCGCSPPGTGTVCSASGKLTQQPATGATNTAAQTTLYYLQYISFSTFLCMLVEMYLFFFRRSGVFGFKSPPLPSLYGRNKKKKTSLNLAHLIFDTKVLRRELCY